MAPPLLRANQLAGWRPGANVLPANERASDEDANGFSAKRKARPEKLAHSKHLRKPPSERHLLGPFACGARGARTMQILPIECGRPASEIKELAADGH